MIKNPFKTKEAIKIESDILQFAESYMSSFDQKERLQVGSVNNNFNINNF